MLLKCVVGLLALLCSAAGSRIVLQSASSGADQALLDLTAPLRIDPNASAPAPLANSPATSQSGRRRQLLSSSSGELQIYLATNGCNFQAACYGWVTWYISGNTFHTGVSNKTPSQYNCNLNSGIDYTYSQGAQLSKLASSCCSLLGVTQVKSQIQYAEA